MFLLLISRADSGYSPSTKSDSSQENHGSNKTTQIIIGVVVGGVAAIAITAGIIFFLIKKRKWDRIRQCEERLLDYQLATGYSSKLQSRSVTPEDYVSMMTSPPPTSTTVPYPYNAEAIVAGQEQRQGQDNRPMTRARGLSAPASTTLPTVAPAHSPESPPPAYQTIHPRYDPSRYSQMSTRFSSSFDITPSSTNIVGNAQRNTWGLSVSGVLSGPSHNPNVGARPESSTWFQQQQGQQYQPHHYQPGSAASGSASVSNWQLSSEATTTPEGPSELNSTSSRGLDQGSRPGERGPRRPKPVLSRLITNL